MFLNAAGSSCPYEDPWHSSYEDRLKELTARQKKVAYLYESPDAHTFRYRVFNMVEALEAQPELGVSASWFTRSDLEVHDSFVDKVDVLIISRVRYDALVGRLISRARARGLRVLFDIDDLILTFATHTSSVSLSNANSKEPRSGIGGLAISHDWVQHCSFVMGL
jgi:hypothetical protein